MLWSGKVTQEISPNDNESFGILEFNKKVNKDSRVENVLVPVRDGLMVLRLSLIHI